MPASHLHETAAPGPSLFLPCESSGWEILCFQAKIVFGEVSNRKPYSKQFNIEDLFKMMSFLLESQSDSSFSRHTHGQRHKQTPILHPPFPPPSCKYIARSTFDRRVWKGQRMQYSLGRLSENTLQKG